MTVSQAPDLPLQKKLVTIASGKGGVGKTWLSVTLSHALSLMGRQVLLFDGDLGLANVDIQLGITPERDVGAFIAGDASLASVISNYEAGASEKGGCFHVIPGKSGSGALGSLSREMLIKLRTGLIAQAQNYDHVLLDLAAGIDPAVTILAHHQGLVLVAMTADPTSLTDAYAFIKVMSQKNPQANIQIAVNNVPNKREGEKAYERIRKVCEGFLKISPPLAGIIRQDPKVVEAIRSQTPLLTRFPGANAADDIKTLAQNLFSA